MTYLQVNPMAYVTSAYCAIGFTFIYAIIFNFIPGARSWEVMAYVTSAHCAIGFMSYLNRSI